VQEIKDFYEYTEECMKRIIRMEVPNLKEIEHLLIKLPNNLMEELKYKKLAIFDLDETLVHCEIKKPQKAQVQINVNLPSNQKAMVNIPFNIINRLV
jgi:hypothetical protein